MSNHPHNATLMEYANRTLPRLHGDVLAMHLAHCPQCRRFIRGCEDIGGVMLESLAPDPISPALLPDTLAIIDAGQPARVSPPAPPSTMALMAARKWRWLAPGIHLKTLVRRDASNTRMDLIRVAPGMSLPQHNHTGDEIAYIVQGGFSDSTGIYRTGDIAQGQPGLDHAPHSLPGEDCICLMATTGRLRAQSKWVRAMQGMLDI